MNGARRPTGQLRFATVFFVICFLTIGYYLFVILRPFFSVLLLAAMLTVIFRPLYREILRATRGHPSLASFVTCIIILLLIVLPLFLLGALVTKQSLHFYQGIQASLNGAGAERLDEFQNRPFVKLALDQGSHWLGTERVDLRTAVTQILGTVSRFLVSRSPSLLKGIGDLLFGFLLMFISMFFLLRDGPLLIELLKASSPLPHAYESEIFKNFQDVSYATFFGSILTAIVQGVAGALLFWALRIDAPLFWGAIIAFVSLIPIVGGFLVWLPWTGYLLVVGQTGRAIALLAVGGLIVSSIDNVLKPIIIQGRTNMHPLLVFLSVLGGMDAFGFLGIVLGPLIVALFVSFLRFYKLEFRETLERKLAER